MLYFLYWMHQYNWCYHAPIYQLYQPGLLFHNSLTEILYTSALSRSIIVRLFNIVEGI